jgi:hypothetical protein
MSTDMSSTDMSIDKIKTDETAAPKPKRGFAAMDPKKHAEICSAGGRAAHAKGSAHQFTKEEAVVAGRKGGIAVHKNRKRKAAQATP